MSENIPRVFAYSTGVLALGAFFYIATHSLYRFTEYPGFTGWLTIFGFVFVIANITYMIGKRYYRRPSAGTISAFVLGMMFVAPTIVQLILNNLDAGVDQRMPFLFVTLIAGAGIGTHFGVKKGEKLREERLQRKEEHENS
jgi:hypothetical protein